MLRNKMTKTQQNQLEKLLESEKDSSFKILKSKLPYKNSEFIEDVYCEARLKAIKHFDKYHQHQPFRPWWSRILIRCMYDKINSDKEIPFENIPESYKDYQEDFLNSLKLSEIMKIIDAMPQNNQKPMLDLIIRETDNEHSSVPLKNSERQALCKARKKFFQISCNI